MRVWAGKNFSQQATFKNASGNAVDPATVTLYICPTVGEGSTSIFGGSNPAGIQKIDTGVYCVSVDTTGMAGDLVVEWDGEGVDVFVTTFGIDAPPYP